jgi:hypothetical protein
MHATETYYQNKIAELEAIIRQKQAVIDDLVDSLNRVLPLTNR